MAYRIYKEETVLIATAQLMGFINFSYCSYGMQFAMEGELSDLKGLVDPETFTGVEFDLLDTLDCPVVKHLMAAVKDINDSLNILLIINSMDEYETMCNEEGSTLANGIFNRFAVHVFPYKDRNDALGDIAYAYYTTTFCLYLMAFLLLTGGVNLDCESFYHFCSDCPTPVDLELLNNGDKNIKLLCELMATRIESTNGVHNFYI